jgi:hypothetical protein
VRRLAAACLGAAAFISSPVTACPACPAGRQARSEVWSCGFGENLLRMLLPFVVIGVICASIEWTARAPAPVFEKFRKRRRSKQRDGRSHDEVLTDGEHA